VGCLPLVSNKLTTPLTHNPRPSNNPLISDLTFDRFLKNEEDLVPQLLQSKEESAPTHVFNTY
jgi:hypothetical protein